MNPQDLPKAVAPSPRHHSVETSQQLAGRDLRPRGTKWIKAAAALADSKTNAEAAQAAGVTTAAVRFWKRNPRFMALLGRYQQAIERELLETGIASQKERVKNQNDRHRRMKRLIEARAAEAARPESLLAGVPGADTGLVLVDETEVIGEGDNARIVVTRVKTDVALLKEMRELEETVAKEKGGQFEDTAAGGPGGDRPAITIVFPVLSVEDQKAIENAPYIDLPPATRRLMSRPSDGKPL